MPGVNTSQQHYYFVVLLFLFFKEQSWQSQGTVPEHESDTLPYPHQPDATRLMLLHGGG